MKRALIVDDSKTAQLRLKKMLRAYSLHVDVAFSAEEALAYLAYEAPSIIFLDHHMEGMDGLEALKIIKANPNTAMIPVVMYTAQKGDMYVGQARALGALDILSKEIMKASSLQRVLASLGIQPVEGETPSEVDYTEESTDQHNVEHNITGATGQVAAEDPKFHALKADISRIIESHIAEVRQQISDNARTVVYKVSEEIEKSLDKDSKVGDIPLSVIRGDLDHQQRRASILSSSLLVLIFLGLALLTYELIATKNELKFIGRNYSELLEQNRINDRMRSAERQQPSLRFTKEDRSASPEHLDITSWAINTDWQFDYGSPPLDENRVANISNLVYRLDNMGYTGTVELNINFGNVCLQQEDSGLLRLADEEMPLEECVMFQEINPEFLVSDYLTIAYLNFEQSADPIQNGNLDIEITTNGVSSPRFEYPVPGSDINAGMWNKIALKNNHIAVFFTNQ